MRLILVLIAGLALANCATDGASTRTRGLSADAQQALDDAKAENQNEAGAKASLDASVQKYRTVTLTDDEGKPKMICKRVKQPGTLFETKVCATKKEWDGARQAGKDTTDGIQRKMDARCGAAGC